MIPERLRICGVDYTVTLHDELDRRTDMAGTHSPELLRIMLQHRGINDQRLEQNFFHELLHAIDEHFNNYSLQEEVVDRLAKGIYQVMSDNQLLNPQIFGKRGRKR